MKVFGRVFLPGGRVAAVTGSGIRNPRFGLPGATATPATTPSLKAPEPGPARAPRP